MRVHEITCPHCGSGMKSKAGIPAGQTIACPKCRKKFAVEAADEIEVVEDFEVDEPAPKKKKGPPPAPARKPARRDEDDETEDEEPLPRKKAKRRPADDTEEEELPRKKKKKKRRQDDEEESLYLRLKHNVLVRVITLVVLFGILAVLAYLLYEKRMAEEAANSARPPAVRLV